jgi:glycerophosphoryl diester phosphodiesterase
VGSVIASLVWIPLPNTCSCPIELGPSNLFTFGNLRDYCEPHGYVAHAFGEIDDTFYTNSREAFELNYEKGFRIFEVDLVLLKDGSAFCAHNGTEWMYGLDKPFTETTAEEISGRLCLGKYTPLTGSELLDLVYEYTDVYFMLDTKHTTQGSTYDILRALVSEAKGRHPSVLDRMIPHIFGPGDLCEVAEIYPFRDYWVAVYSFERKTNRGSGTNADRVMLYVVSNGGPVRLLRIMDALEAYALPSHGPFAVLSRLQCPAFGLLSSLYDLKVYASVDTGVTSPGPS